MSNITVAPDATEPQDPTIPVLDQEPTSEDRPAVYVIGDDFFAVTSDGLLKVQMRLKTRLFKEVLRSSGDDVEQFLLVIDGIGDDETIAQLDELDIFETAQIAASYFQAWREKQQATVGEARRSSN